MKSAIMSLLNQARDWGVGLIHAADTTAAEKVLQVRRQSDEGFVILGRLYKENDQFVFQYDPEYVGEPISAFPWVNREYRSDTLWPFFAVRIPPLEREDVRKTISELSLRGDQTIEILDAVARLSATNPYEFKLADWSPQARQSV